MILFLRKVMYYAERVSVAESVILAARVGLNPLPLLHMLRTEIK